MKYLFLLGCTFAFSAPAMAQDDAGEADIVLIHKLRDEYITVVASGTDQPIFDIGQSLSVVGVGEIAAVQGADIARVIERLPGVVLTRNGGLGGFTGLRVRGSNAEQVLVMVDGVRVADVASPGGGYDLGNLTSGGIGKIELLRGSNSVVWGSQAMGGVLAVTSEDVNGLRASAEYGAHDSFTGDAAVGLAGNGHALTLSGGHVRTDGISSAASGSEADGFRQWRIGGKGRLDLAPGTSLNAAARHAASRLDIDGFPPPTYSFADTPEFQKTRETSGRLGLRHESDAVTLDAGLSASDTRRAYYDPTFGSDPNFATRGRSHRAELRGRWSAAQAVTVHFGADSEWSRFSTTFDPREKARASSAHVLIGWKNDPLDLSAGARIDDHSRFGSEVTLGANASLRIAGNWRLRASYGEGFKAPTLYQLYSDYGNLALSPERGRSFDIGIERGDRNGPLHFAVTAFRRDTRGLIDYVSCFSVADPLCADGRFGFYANVGKARAQGVEVELGAHMGDHLRGQVAYTFLDAKDRTPGGVNRGNDLARRARHALSASLDWETPLAGMMLGGDVRLVGDSFDDGGNFTRIDGYAIGTLRASLPVTEVVVLFGRIENVTDAGYVTVAGYGTPGRSAFIGARARF